MREFLEFHLVLRAGFEPANPYGKGFPIGRSSQSVDLESFTFDLAWLPQHITGYKSSVFWLINHLPEISACLFFNECLKNKG
jgi:hypothetical protein